MNLIKGLLEKGKLEVFELRQCEKLKMEKIDPLASLQEGAEGMWLWLLDTNGFHHMPYLDILSKKEQEGLRQLRSAKECAMRSRSRIFLRALLSHQTNIAAADLSFVYGAEGKPEMVSEHDSPYAFNASHSGNTIAIMVGTVDAVGLDIESGFMAHSQIMSIAQRFFHNFETAQLSKLPPEAMARCFRKLWTYKEAWLKNKGLGITSIFSTPEWQHWDFSEEENSLQQLSHQGLSGFQWEINTHCITGLYTQLS